MRSNKAAASEMPSRTFFVRRGVERCDNDVAGNFHELENGTGDLALWWEVARGRRLGRRTAIAMLRPERPARSQVMRVSSRGRRRQSQALVFLALRRILR